MVGRVNDANGDRERPPLTAGLFLLPLACVLMSALGALAVKADWSPRGRIWLDAQKILPVDCACGPPELVLHVSLAPQRFVLTWRKGDRVEAATEVPRPSGELRRYAGLTAQITREWQAHGLHRQPSDQKLDQVVVHAEPRMPYREMVALIDAIQETRREFQISPGKRHPAFNVQLVVDEP